MQSQFNDNMAQEQLDSVHIVNELRKMTGVEYVILHSREPDFWIIRKQNRSSPTETQPMADYYVVGANVYMAPTVKDVVSSRMLSTALSLQRALGKLQGLASYSPADGHSYKYQLGGENGVGGQQAGTAAAGTATGAMTGMGTPKVRTVTGGAGAGAGTTPYTPAASATPTVNTVNGSAAGGGVGGGGGAGLQLSRSTVNNLFNVSLTGHPVYLDEAGGDV